MKGLYVLVALCAIHMIQANPISILEEMVKEQRINLQKVMQDVVPYHVVTKNNLEEETKRLLVSGKVEIDKAITSALDTVTKAIEAAKKGGKDVEHCFKDAKTMFEVADIMATSELKNCIDYSTPEVVENLKHIEYLIENAENLDDDLNEVIPKCKTEDLEKMKVCVQNEVNIAEIVIENLEARVRVAKRQTSEAFNKAMSKARECVSDMVHGIRSRSTVITLGAEKCIRLA